ncbi:MAG: alpha/beta hydrolase [Candidatus Binatia bacterium]
MPFVFVRTGRVSYESVGAGPPIVLMHANPGDRHDFDAVVPELARTHRVIAIDWPGYGDSDAPVPEFVASARLFADVLADVLDVFALDRVVLCGNGVGGFAAATLAIEQPARVRGLVLVAPSGFTPMTRIARAWCAVRGRDFVTRLLAGPMAYAYLRRRTPTVAAIRARARRLYGIPPRVAVEAAVWRSLASPESDLRARAARIKQPALLVLGRRDPMLRLRTAGRAAAAAMPGARLVTIDTGHEPFAEAPQEFLTAVRPFLDALPA